MKIKHLILHSLGHAAMVLLYTSGIAWVLFNSQKLFGKGPQNFGGPLAVLLLFLLSAAITGALVLGRPAMLYFNGHKTEAVKFFGLTISWLFVATLALFLILWK